MREEAVVEIYGTLEQDVTICHFYDGSKYGIMTASVRRNNKAVTSITANYHNITHIPILIRNQELLNSGELTANKGRKALIIGKLEFFDRALRLSGADRFGLNKVLDKKRPEIGWFKLSTMVVSINHRAGIRILKEELVEDKNTSCNQRSLIVSKTCIGQT